MKNSADLYLDLLKKTLSFSLWPEPPAPIGYYRNDRNAIKRFFIKSISAVLDRSKYTLTSKQSYSEQDRENGEVWPSYADTMVGMKRLNNLQYCMEETIRNNIPGDVIETGVWRGGSCIFMRAILKVHDISDKKVFVADSFEGLPEPDEKKHPADKGDILYSYNFLRVSEEEVRNNFSRYDLLDEQVVFLKGFFADTLPTAPIEKLSVLRLDGDMYSSTIDALNSLYPKLSKGGFCIVDDYAIPACAKAVHDYREENGITDEMITIDRIAKFWKKTV